MFEIITLEELLKRLDNYNHKELHLHHTWSPSHKNFTGNNGIQLQENMKRYHVETLGWADIGQHVTLLPDGLFVTGRDFGRTPASISGLNTGAFACEMLGNFDIGNDIFGGNQKNSALGLAKYFDDKNKYVRFHRENSPKTCPGTSIDKDVFMSEVKNYGKETIVQTSVEVTTPQPVVEQPKKTWENYITGDLAKELQSALNSVYSRNLSIDGYLGDKSIEAFEGVLVVEGQKNTLVKVIQKRLMQLGYNLNRYGADGAFGKGGETAKAIRQFQADRHLVVDCKVGKNTLKELFRK